MLSISTAGRLAALDLRLVGRSTDRPGKIEVAADRIATIWAEHRHAIYPGPDGRAHPVPGTLQIVFSDLGTPKPGEWSVYEELRSQLVARGLPRTAVRFVHEATNDREKGELFAACRNGQVAVLVGSTERMGVGTNVQNRAVALHHLDCPWRPSDIRQREGRVLRQGNLHREVQILRYVTEGSFDGFVWGTVERKATFIGQVMRGRLDVREIEDIGDAALTYQEVKALATGNPLLLDQAQAEANLTRLERLERAHTRSQADLRVSIRSNESAIADLEPQLAAATAAIAYRRDTRGDAFRMIIEGQAASRRPEAEIRLKAALARLLADHHGVPDGTWTEVGSLGGFAVAARAQRAMTQAPALTVALREVPDGEIRLTAEQIGESALVSRLENRLTGLEHFRDDAALRIERLRGEVRTADGLLGTPFSRAAELVAARARVQELSEQLKAIANRQVDDDARPARPAVEVTAARPDSAYAPAIPSLRSDRWEQRKEWARQAAAAPTPMAVPQLGGRPGAGRMA